MIKSSLFKSVNIIFIIYNPTSEKKQKIANKLYKDNRVNFIAPADYEDGNKIDMIQTSIADFNESLFALSEKHEVYQLDMTGPKKYIKGLEKQIKEAEMTKYSANKIEVNII